MNIVIQNEDENIGKIYINKKEIYPLNSNTFYVPEDYLLGKNIKIEEMPEHISFQMCSGFVGRQPFLSDEFELTYCIAKIDNNVIKIDFQTCFEKDSWNKEYNIDFYMKRARDVVGNMQEMLKNITINKFQDNSKLVCLDFSSLYCADTFDSAIEYANQILEDYKIDLNIALGSGIRDLNRINTEKEFRTDVMIPLLKKMKFINVRDNHGVNEYGKDIIFAKITEFGEYEYWGVQLKFGNISGNVNSGINTLTNQTELAFKMPFNDIYTKTEQRISKFIIAISGEYTDNAVAIITKSIENNKSINNTIYLDKPKIESLIDKYYK